MVGWFWLTLTGKASVRLFAVSTSVGIAVAGLLLWILLEEEWIFILAGFMALAALVVLLSLPKINPDLVRRLRLRW
jgi:multisubunit Na+/H+ antiporter MnhE subunit